MKALWGKFYIVLLLGSALGSAEAGQAQRNKLFKVFHHRAQVEPGTVPFLELGKLVLSFAREPDMEIVNGGLNGAMLKRTFNFSMTEIADAECRQMLQALASNQNKAYRISYDIVEKPNPTLRLTVFYDHDKVGISHALVETGGAHKRLILTFYDKEQIRRIKNAQEQVLTTACSSLQRRPGVIVDCGHGGEDNGAVGCFDLKEKDINLEVGMYVADMLKKKGYDVFLTRTADEQVALDDRTLMTACNKSAHLFVSIHANAALNDQASGIETFFFDIANYCKNDDKHSKLTTALMHERSKKSLLLANNIHQGVLGHARRAQPDVIDRHVQSLFLQVLVGASVPAALVEIGFLTNKKEAALINNKQYKMLLASGICDGIIHYCEGSHKF